MHSLWIGICIFLLVGDKGFSKEFDELNDECTRVSSKSSKLSCQSLEPFQKSLSFAGGGYFTFTYNVGIIKCLREKFELDDVVFLGDSSGSLAAFVAAVGLPAEITQNLLLKAIKEKNEAPCYGVSRWGEIMTKIILTAIEECDQDLEAYKRASNRMYVSVTRVNFSSLSFCNELIGTYNSDKDLAEGIIASCHIPWLFSERFRIKWRDNYYVDGGFTNSNPKLNSNTMCITPFLWRSLDFWLKNGCFTLPTEKEALFAIQLGYEDAMAHQDEFLAYGLKPKNFSVPRVIADSMLFDSTKQRESKATSSCVLEKFKKLLSFPNVLLKSLIVLGFFGKNIILSQGSIHFSTVKSMLFCGRFKIVQLFKFLLRLVNLI